jgi:hypothetical protein
MKKRNCVMRAIFAGAAVLLATGAGGTAWGAFIVVDDFNSNMVPIVAPAAAFSLGWDVTVPYINSGNPPYTNTLVYSETSVPGVLGGTRVTTATNHSDGNISVDLLSASPYEYIALSTPGWYSSSYGEMLLLYDGGGGGGGLNQDMSAWTSLNVDFDPDHVGNLKTTVMSFTLNDGLNSATVSQSWATYNTLPRTVVNFNLADFQTNNPSLDLSSVNSILFKYEGDSGADTAFYSITATVPEPATMSLLALGGLALIRRRRRA